MRAVNIKSLLRLLAENKASIVDSRVASDIINLLGYYQPAVISPTCCDITNLLGYYQPTDNPKRWALHRL